MGLKEQREELPVYVNKVNLADLMLDVRIIILLHRIILFNCI